MRRGASSGDDDATETAAADAGSPSFGSLEGAPPKKDENVEKAVGDEGGASAVAAAAAAGGDCPDDGDYGSRFATRSSPAAMLERRPSASDSAFVALASASAFASLHRLTSSPNRSISAL